MSQRTPESQPWLSWLDRLPTSDEELRKEMYRPVVPVKNLGRFSAYQARRALRAAWSEVFIPSAEHVRILKSWIQWATEHSREKYPSYLDFNRSLDLTREHHLGNTHGPTRCLTGLAGVSKTSFIRVCEQVFRSRCAGRYASETQIMTLHPFRLLQMRTASSVSAVLRQLANPTAVTRLSRIGPSDLIEHVRDWLHASATSLLIVDEMQFLTPSASASTRTSQLLTTLSTLGVPLVYVANYSLIHKLQKRPHEERDRLLSRPEVLCPPPEESNEWKTVVQAFLDVAPEHFKFDASNDIERLHRLTGGLFRTLGALLESAYEVAKDQGLSAVNIGSVEQAYNSAEFSHYRTTVETLRSISEFGWSRKKHDDLICPFPTITPPVPKAVAIGTGSQNPSVDIGRALVESSLRPDERKILNAERKKVNVAATNSERATPKPKRSKVTTSQAQSLLDGAKFFREEYSKPRKNAVSRQPRLKIVSSKDHDDGSGK